MRFDITTCTSRRNSHVEIDQSLPHPVNKAEWQCLISCSHWLCTPAMLNAQSLIAQGPANIVNHTYPVTEQMISEMSVTADLKLLPTMQMMNSTHHCHILYPVTHYLTSVSPRSSSETNLLFTQRARLTGSLHSTNARFTELCTAAADEVRVPEREEAYGTGESVWNRVHELILVPSNWERSTRFSHNAST